jgi:hypothetical protein
MFFIDVRLPCPFGPIRGLELNSMLVNLETSMLFPLVPKIVDESFNTLLQLVIMMTGSSNRRMDRHGFYQEVHPLFFCYSQLKGHHVAGCMQTFICGARWLLASPCSYVNAPLEFLFRVALWGPYSLI